MKTTTSISLICLLPLHLLAQKDTLWQQKPNVKIGGYIDLFYAYDFNKPKTDYRQTFFYNYNRHNEFNLNLGYIKLSLEHPKYRANIALQTGTYTNDNYANEPNVLKNIFEANAGISLNKKNSLWLDAGIFASHIGFESAISIDNWTLTRSILAENSPYYLSGAKLTYSPNKKWEVAALVINGWQHIQKVKRNSLPSFGTQVKFMPNEKIILNYSTFIGTDFPDSTRRMRYFHNLYGQFQLNKKIGLIAGFDIGTQQQSKNSSTYDIWFSSVMIARYAFTDKWTTAIRAEYYQDKKGVIIPTTTTNGFKTTGLSLNLDYTPILNIACRLEGRWLHSQDKVFFGQNTMTNNNVFLVASIAVKFDKTIK